jgi:aminoglycoside phosphotransferase (APT) family kinase protein
LIDVDRLASWLDGTDLPGKGAPLDQRFVSGGTQNEIYDIRRDGLHCAMRIPPARAPLARDSGIRREWRILKALRGSDVPHPQALVACDDPSVLGRAFYLTEFVDGWSPMESMSWPSPFDVDSQARSGLAYQLVEGAALVSLVDWKQKGLADLGRPEGFHERQVDRWTSVFREVKAREVPGFDEAADWLRSNRPLDFQPGRMHGDYQFGNVMFSHGTPARLRAVIDWEMSTIGDPKLDLAWMLNVWPEDTRETVRPFPSYVDLTGLPARSALLEHYAVLTGRQVDDIDYYTVLATWKLAVVLEQGLPAGRRQLEAASLRPSGA